MNKNIFKSYLSNSIVNLVGALFSAAYVIIVPSIVSGYFSVEIFSLWSLALQIIVYVNFLGMGLQTATARAIAFNDADNFKRDKFPEIVRAAQSIAKWAALVAILVILLLIFLYPLFFHDIPVDKLGDFQIVILVFGISAVFQILSQVEMGAFQGLQKNIFFVSVQSFVRVLSLLFVWVGVKLDFGFVAIAILMAIALSLIFPLMRVVFLKSLSWARSVRSSPIVVSTRKEILIYCGSLSVWAVSMLAVNSAGILIVGKLDFKSVGAYSIAMTGALGIVSLLSAGISPLMAISAKHFSSLNERKNLPEILKRSTVLMSFIIFLIVGVVFLFKSFLIEKWVGASYVKGVAPLLVVLVTAHCLRNIAAPYSLMLLSAGLHKRALVTAIYESIANIVFSIIFGWVLGLGAFGVALGSFAGALIGVAGNFLINAKKTPELTPESYGFFLRYILLPLTLSLVFCSYLILMYLDNI